MKAPSPTTSQGNGRASGWSVSGFPRIPSLPRITFVVMGIILLSILALSALFILAGKGAEAAHKVEVQQANKGHENSNPDPKAN